VGQICKCGLWPQGWPRLAGNLVNPFLLKIKILFGVLNLVKIERALNIYQHLALLALYGLLLLV
jgi:hypothetical protein